MNSDLNRGLAVSIQGKRVYMYLHILGIPLPVLREYLSSSTKPKSVDTKMLFSKLFEARVRLNRAYRLQNGRNKVTNGNCLDTIEQLFQVVDKQ